MFYPGVECTCLIDCADIDTTYDQFGSDRNQTVVFKFREDNLKLVNVYPEVGDIIQFNNRYHEIDNVVQEQFLGGIPDKSFSIITNTHYSRLSKLNHCQKDKYKMIKLKLLLEEIQSQTSWKIPEGTPDEVVNVLHSIVAELIKRKKKNIKDYVRFQHIYKNKKLGVLWTIYNKKHPEVSLVFHEWTNEWYAPHIGSTPISPNILQAIINRWVV